MNHDLTNCQQSGKSIVVYRSSDGVIQLEVQLVDDNVWLTQVQMALLFGCSTDNISFHLKNVYEEHEIDRNSTAEFFSVVQKEGRRMVNRQVMHYNLDAILSVGYRISSSNATKFRQWASRVLKNYLMHGYAFNQRFERLEQRVSKTEEKIDFFVKSSLPPVEGVFYNGQIFDAYTFISDLVRKAETEIVLIDNYVDDTVLKILDKRKVGVSAVIYTSNFSEKLKLDLAKHNAQYQPINIDVFKKSHDRFLIVDDGVYHIGASIKDLGKSICAFSKLDFSKDEILHHIKET